MAGDGLRIFLPFRFDYAASIRRVARLVNGLEEEKREGGNTRDGHRQPGEEWGSHVIAALGSLSIAKAGSV
jgi:hypothetical protein